MPEHITFMEKIMISFEKAYCRNRNIAINASLKEPLEGCYTKAMENMRRSFAGAEKMSFKGSEYKIVGEGYHRPVHKTYEEMYREYVYWDSNTVYMVIEVFFGNLPPLPSELKELFKNIVNPSDERRGHSHNVSFDQYILGKSGKSIILFGSEYINND